MKRVGILTGGGDVPGLNAAIQQFVWRMEEEGYEVLGLRRGWAALLHVKPYHDADNSSWLVPLTRASTRTIDRSGGTVLHSSRINPARVKPEDEPPFLREGRSDDMPRDHTGHALRVIEQLGLGALIPIGGDDTLSFALRLHQEGVPIVAIPKTMDNDVFGTDYCIGFSTAVTRSVNFINDLRTVAGSHERFLVVELFGRHSGETCLLSSYLAGTDRALIAEVPFDIHQVVDMLAQDKQGNPSNYAVCTISEGATLIGGRLIEGGPEDAYGHKKLGGIGQLTAELLKERTRQGMIYQQLGYLMRSGTPDSLDLMVAINYAVMATDLVVDGTFGRLTALRDGNYANVPLAVLGQGVKRVDVDALYDEGSYRPKIRHVDGKPMFLN